MQTLWTEATIRFAFDILSSEQNSMRMAVRAAATALKGRRASQNDYMYFHLFSFVDAEMSRCMTLHLPECDHRQAQDLTWLTQLAFAVGWMLFQAPPADQCSSLLAFDLALNIH